MISIVSLLLLSLFVTYVVAQKFNIDVTYLPKGWNLISVDLQMVGKSLNDTTIITGLSKEYKESLKFIEPNANIETCDLSAGWLFQNGKWLLVKPTTGKYTKPPFDSAVDVVDFNLGHVGLGMWVKVDNENGCTLGCGYAECNSDTNSVRGFYKEDMQLVEGWNLISVTTTMLRKSLKDIKDSNKDPLNCEIDAAWLFKDGRWLLVEPTTGKYTKPPFDSVVEVTAFEPSHNGFGLWVKVENSCKFACGESSCLERGLVDTFSRTLFEGGKETVTSGGIEYEVTVVFVDKDSVKFIVNGESTPDLTLGRRHTLSDGSIIQADHIFYEDFAGGIKQSAFVLFVY